MEEIKNLLKQYLEERDWKRVRQEIGSLEALPIAELLETLPKPDQVILFRLLPRGLAKETFEHLSHNEQEAVVFGLAAQANLVADLLNDLAPDDRTAFLEELPGEVSQRLIQLLSADQRDVALRLMGYPENSIGRLMTPEYVAVRPHDTVQKALEHIRRFGRDSETLNVIYVVDDHWRLIDDLRIKEIILAPPERTIAEIGDNRFVALNADDDQEVAVKLFRDYGRVALPVTDTDGILLGIVTVDDVLDVAEREHTEDFHKFGGTERLDLSYTKTGLAEMVRKRAGWLVILFLSEMLTASAMGHFDSEISKAVVLALFIPLIISSGGNSGSQAASLIIRSLALGELHLGHWWYVLRKELASGLLLGVILGLIGFARITVWQETGLYDYGAQWAWVGLSVSVSLVFIVMWGCLSGAMIPFLLKRAGLDPATASAPFVATLVDVTGLIIYFSIAALFLGGRLL